MLSNTVITFVLFVSTAVNAQNLFPPEPLPEVTPPDVVNLFIQYADDGAGDYVASVVNVDSTATTFSLTCNPDSTKTMWNGEKHECGFAAWTAPIIITQGPSTMRWEYSESSAEGTYTLTDECTFDGTRAKTATCTNFWDDTRAPAQSETITYDGSVLAYTIVGSTMTLTQSYIDFESSAAGPPPFIPVKITGGLEKLKAMATASGDSITETAAKSTSTPSITSAATLGASNSVGTAVTSTTSSQVGGSNAMRPSVWLAAITMGLAIYLRC